jgi:hypothetical protein
VFTVRFGSVFIKKSNQTEIFFLKKPKPNRNRFKPTGFGSVRFFREKTGSNWLGSVFSVWLGFGSVFFGLARFFRFGSVLARFFRFGLVLARFGSVFFRVFSVRFGFSGSRLKKPKPNRTGRFF